MTDPLEDQDDASTPLTAEEREELIPSYITLRRDRPVPHSLMAVLYK